MAEQKQCPLKIAAAKGITDDTACKPNCAWYVLTSDKQPMCAITMMAEFGR